MLLSCHSANMGMTYIFRCEYFIRNVLVNWLIYNSFCWQVKDQTRRKMTDIRSGLKDLKKVCF